MTLEELIQLQTLLTQFMTTYDIDYGFTHIESLDEMIEDKIDKLK